MLNSNPSKAETLVGKTIHQPIRLLLLDDISFMITL